jgi:hypothetical protein
MSDYNRWQDRLTNAADLMHMPLPTKTQQAVALLRVAADQLERGGEEDRASWRVADAAGMLRQVIGEAGIEAQGVTYPTGRGAMLPVLKR